MSIIHRRQAHAIQVNCSNLKYLLARQFLMSRRQCSSNELLSLQKCLFFFRHTQFFCIASISFSAVFLRTGIYEETVSMVFSPYNFTFTVLFCKQIIKKKRKKKKKEKLYFPRNLTSPLRRIREHGEKLILPSFADFCLSDSLTPAHYAVWHVGRLCLSENIGI